MYPPVSPKKLTSLKAELRLTPEAHRSDALQEAWLAHLEGRDPVKAVVCYRVSELRHERHETPFSQLDKEQQKEVAAILSVAGKPAQKS